jgi:hypothetical protein
MGIRVRSWLGAEDGIASHFLSGPLDRFAAWAQEVEAESPGDLALEAWDLLTDVRARGAAVLRATDAVHAARVDRLLDLYYGDFCDFGPGRHLLRSADDATLPERYYTAALPLLERSPSHRPIADLWRLLLTGRPVLRDAREFPYESGDGVFRLSYWTHDECTHLRRERKALVTWAGTPRSEGEHALEAMLRAVETAIEVGVGLIFTVS